MSLSMRPAEFSASLVMRPEDLTRIEMSVFNIKLPTHMWYVDLQRCALQWNCDEGSASHAKYGGMRCQLPVLELDLWA